MKKIAFALGFLCLNAFSQTVVLNQDEMTLESNEVVFDKPASSPSFIVLNVPVPTTQQVCVRSEQREVFGQNGEQCGYDLIERQDCFGGYYGGYPYPYPGRRGGVIIRRGGGPRGPMGPGHIRRGRLGVGVGVSYAPITNGCRYYTERVPRSCNFYESFCAEFETKVTNVYKKFNLQFAKFDTAAQINFSLDENNNLVVDVVSHEPSCIKKTFYGPRGGDTTGIKLTLQKRCR